MIFYDLSNKNDFFHEECLLGYWMLLDQRTLLNSSSLEVFFAGDACREALVQQGDHPPALRHICFWFTYGFQMILLYATNIYTNIIYGYPVVLCQSPSPRIFHQDDWPPTLLGHFRAPENRRA